MFGRGVYSVSTRTQSPSSSPSQQHSSEDSTNKQNTVFMAASGKEKEKDMGAPTSPWLAEWGPSSTLLKEFHTKHEVPNLVKVTKGHYMNIGVNRFPLQKTHQQLYLHSVRSCIKVLSHSVQKMSDDIRPGSRRFRLSTSKMLPLEQRLSIPITYQGWFEVLSEDGKGSKLIESVPELAKTFPEKCLVRQDILSYCANDDGKLSRIATKMISKGEQLRLSGVMSTSFPPSNSKVKLLRCINSKGENVYLPFDQKGTFSAIATPDNITGVQQIQGIVKKYRMPLTVKLIQGVWPRVDSNRFTGFVRLDWVYIDETAFVCPFEKDQLRMIPVPLNAPLQLCPAVNFNSMTERDNYKSILHRCNRMISNYNNTIHLLINLPEVVVKNSTNRMTRNLFSVASKPQTRSRAISKKKEEKLMNEIDDLYQYVRDGGTAPESKFTYDSDEESYWEEPAYEPIDDFQQRLKALDTGKLAKFTEKHKSTDLTKAIEELNQYCSNDENDKKSSPSPSKKSQEEEIKELVKKQELLRISAKSSENLSIEGSTPKSSDNENGKKETIPPQLPPRRYNRSGSMPMLDVDTSIMTTLNHSNSEKFLLLQSKSSKTTSSSQDSSSSGSRRRNSQLVQTKSQKKRGMSFTSKRRQTMYL